MAYKPLLDQVADKFVLKGCEKNLKVTQVEMNYQPKGKTYENLKSFIPTFNHDKLFFTPAFSLPTDQKYFMHNQTFQRYQFNQKVERHLEHLTQHKIQKPLQILMLASPTTKYCQICQQKYENYFEHVALELHNQTAKSNPINTAIQQLCRSLKTKKANQNHSHKRKSIKKRSRHQKIQEIAQNHVMRQDLVAQGSASYAKSTHQSTILSQKMEIINDF